MFFKKNQRPVAPIVHADDSDFETLVGEQPGVTVVDFWAPWCGPCRMMAPILDDVAIEQADQGVTVMKVNVDEAPVIAERFGIRSIPTLIFFREGEPLFEMVGMVPKPVLDRELGELIASGQAR
jgi:thioredoxin 1